MNLESRRRKLGQPKLRPMDGVQRIEDITPGNTVEIFVRGRQPSSFFYARVLEKIVSNKQPTNPIIRIHRDDRPNHQMLVGGGTSARVVKMG